MFNFYVRHFKKGMRSQYIYIHIYIYIYTYKIKSNWESGGTASLSVGSVGNKGTKPFENLQYLALN